MSKRKFRWLIAGCFGLLLVVQLAPYGREHWNPPVRKEPVWNSPQTKDLAVRACYDCHSNETVWPWYSNIAPVSWLVQRDVNEGRKKLNFSEWDRRQEEAHESAKTLRKGEMPPWYYPWTRLSSAEREELIQGLELTLRKDSKHGRHQSQDRDNDDDDPPAS